MKKAAVIGSPISQSKSPGIFRFLAKKLRVAEFEYLAKEIDPAELDRFLAQVRADQEFVGFNVTVPHKEKVFQLVDVISPEAKAVGAVNVVQREEKAGRIYLHGFNTDVEGVVRTLEASGVKIAGKSVLLYGAGGAARAAGYAAGKLGAKEVFVFNRTASRALRLVKDIELAFPNTKFVAVQTIGDLHHELSLLINATSAGLDGKTITFELPAKVSANAVAFDVIYRSDLTPFMQLAGSYQLRTINGLDMLVYQALATWEIWFGKRFSDAERRSLHDDLVAELRQVVKTNSKNLLFLTGFMGSGKSTVGQEVAKELGWKFVDTDSLIEEQSGYSIADIFTNYGEAHFRALEAETVNRTLALKQAVVSLGGGALMNPSLLEAVKRAGTLVYLSADASELQRRLRFATDRPLLKSSENPELTLSRIKDLLAARLPVYRQANFEIETDQKTPQEVAGEIAGVLKGHKLRKGES